MSRDTIPISLVERVLTPDPWQMKVCGFSVRLVTQVQLLRLESWTGVRRRGGFGERDFVPEWAVLRRLAVLLLSPSSGFGIINLHAAARSRPN